MDDYEFWKSEKGVKGELEIQEGILFVNEIVSYDKKDDIRDKMGI